MATAIPIRARVALVAALAAASTLAGTASAESDGLTTHDWWVALAFCAMLLVVERIDVTLPIGSGSVTTSMGTPVALATGIYLGPGAGALVVLVAHLLDSIIAQRDAIKSATNISTHTLATAAGATAYRLLGDADASALATPTNVAALIAAGLVFFVASSCAFAFIISPALGIRPADFLRANLKLFGLEITALPTMGGLLTILARENALALLLFLIPLLLPQVAYRALTRAERNVREAIETLADVIERREPFTANHSIRVASLVQGILDEMPSVPHELTETIVAAARVHDLGKVAVSDATLLKRGPLTTEERLEMDQHAPIGAQIVGRISAYQATTAIIRHHHERWDGTGYPDRLGGEMIPLGARIIAVADAYDAMVSDRPYRKGLSHETAMAEVIRNAGTQFDPTVVAAFVRSMERRGYAAPTLRPVISRSALA